MGICFLLERLKKKTFRAIAVCKILANIFGGLRVTQDWPASGGDWRYPTKSDQNTELFCLMSVVGLSDV